MELQRITEMYEELKQKKCVKNKTDLAQKLKYGRTYVTGVLNGTEDLTDSFTDRMSDLFKKCIAEYRNEALDTTKSGNAYELKETEEKVVTKSGNAFTILSDGRYRMYVKMVEPYAHGGYISGFEDQYFIENLPDHIITVDEIKRGFYRSFRMLGDSMDYDGKRAIEEGDIVTGRNIDPTQWKSKLHLTKWPDYIIVTNERIIVKTIIAHDVERGIITCESKNPDKQTYPTFELHLSEVRQILNVVKVEKDW